LYRYAEAEAKDDFTEWRTKTTLRLPAGADGGGGGGGGDAKSSSKKRKKTEDDGGGGGGGGGSGGGVGESSMDWVVYPGLFAGGGLDVMSAALLRAMPASLGSGSGSCSVLDFCSGSGTLAAAVRARSPGAKVTLLDADAVALTAARENLGSTITGGAVAAAPCTFVLSDGWAGLTEGETFDLIVSNPPVHLGLQPEFTVLSSLVAGCKAGPGSYTPHSSS
jgi:hypothetical protein